MYRPTVWVTGETHHGYPLSYRGLSYGIGWWDQEIIVVTSKQLLKTANFGKYFILIQLPDDNEINIMPCMSMGFWFGDLLDWSKNSQIGEFLIINSFFLFGIINYC